MTPDTMDVPAAICHNCIHWAHPKDPEELPTCSIPCTGHGIDSYDSCIRFTMRSKWLNETSSPITYAKVVIE